MRRWVQPVRRASVWRLIVALGCIGASVPRSVAAGEAFFPVSVWYSGGKARAPMLSTLTPESRAEWRRDLEQIRELGFNTVRTWVEWAHCEPAPGEWRFDNLRLLCELAGEAGLKVIVQVYADSAPDWVGRQFPDSLLEAQSGEKVPSQAAPGYCTDHPGVRDRVVRFYEEAAKTASAYPNLWAWDLWSEPHILNWAVIDYVPNAQFCYCPHTRARFRAWLEKRHGDLPALNRAWYRNFRTWEEVDPPRFGTILSYTDFIDWKTFIYDKLAGDLRTRYEATRRGDAIHAITSHAAVPSIFTSPFNGDGASDDFLMARQLDYYGTSIYPKHSFPARHWPLWQILVAMDFTRSANLANGGFYIGELQAGPGARGVVVGDPISPEDHRIWLWSAVARGAKAVNFYAYYPMSSGYESNGYGLIELDGRLTDRARESGRNARIVHQNRELLLASRPVASQVAIVYNPLAQMVGGEQHSGPEGGHRDSLIGYWRALWEANIPADFVHRETVEQGRLEGYKLLIVPYPIMWTQAAADGLRRYVEGGGAVLAEARLAWNDHRGYAAEVIPGMGLGEVFGAREKSVRMSDVVAIKPLQEGAGLFAGMKSDGPLQGACFAESFELLPGGAARGLAALPDGAPGLVENRFGKGKTLLVGTFLGLAVKQAKVPAGTRAFIRNVATWAGVEPPVRVHGSEPSDAPLEVRIREVPDGRLVFAFNHTDAARTAHIEFGELPGRIRALRELVSGKTAEPASVSGRPALSSEFSGRGVAVWHVRTGP